MKRILYRIYSPSFTKLEQKSLKQLSNYLKYGKLNRRYWVVEILSKDESYEATEALKIALNDAENELKYTAAIELAKRNIVGMDVYLLEVFKIWDGTSKSKNSSIHSLKQNSAFYLKYYPSENVINTLMTLVENDYDGLDECYQQAIDSLSYLKIENAIIPIFNRLLKVIDKLNISVYYEDYQRVAKIYEYCLDALIEIGGVHSLIKLLIDSNNYKAYLAFTRFCDCSDWEIESPSNRIPKNYLKIIADWKPIEDNNVNELILYYLLRRKYDKIGNLGTTATDFLIEYIREYESFMLYRCHNHTVLACQDDFKPLTDIVEQVGIIKDSKASNILQELYSSPITSEGNYGDSDDECYTRNRQSGLRDAIRIAYKAIENKDINEI